MISVALPPTQKLKMRVHTASSELNFRTQYIACHFPYFSKKDAQMR